MNKEKLLRYATLKSEIKRLTEELEQIKPDIITEMNDGGHEEVILPEIGKFYFKERRTWTYPEEIELAETQLKANKKVAQQVGSATCEISKELNFRGQNENTSIEE